MNFLYFILLLIIIIGVLGIIYVIYYNKMQFLRTKIEQAEGIIDETLRERYDLLVRANDIVKSTLDDGKDYFKEYINLKNKQITNYETDRKLKEAFSILSKLNDDFPVLQKNKELKEIFNSIKASNERITATTSYYNKNTNELNQYVRKFPSLIIAKVHNFKVNPFFDGKDMTDDIYDDFKF
jgi:LemA protein